MEKNSVALGCKFRFQHRNEHLMRSLYQGELCKSWEAIGIDDKKRRMNCMGGMEYRRDINGRSDLDWFGRLIVVFHIMYMCYM